MESKDYEKRTLEEIISEVNDGNLKSLMTFYNRFISLGPSKHDAGFKENKQDILDILKKFETNTFPHLDIPHLDISHLDRDQIRFMMLKKHVDLVIEGDEEYIKNFFGVDADIKEIKKNYTDNKSFFDEAYEIKKTVSEENSARKKNPDAKKNTKDNPPSKKQRDAEIKATVSEYQEYLYKKMENKGFGARLRLVSSPLVETSGEDETEDETEDITEPSAEKNTPVQEKLKKRFGAINELNNRIKDKPNLNDEDIKKAKKALKTCLNNKPEWSERPFLQKLTDVLSIGFKPLYRAFFSKEKELEKKLENDLSPKGPN